MSNELSLNESIIQIRVELQNTKIKKSGKNKFAGFDYYELADFLPKLNELMSKYKVNDLFTIENDKATLTLIKGDEKQTYSMPFVIFETPLTYKKDKSGNFMKDKNGDFIQVPSMQDIQYLGALNTYYKRYLYLNVFGITDGEVIDSMDNNEMSKKTTKTPTKKVNTTKTAEPITEPVEEKKETDFRTLLMMELKKQGININEYAKEHKLNAKTTQEEAKVLLEELIYKNGEEANEDK